jgi:hypothetical protein
VRTTLDIEDDVLLAAKELARKRRTSAGKVISDLARQGLRTSSTTDTGSRSPAEPQEFLGFRPLPDRGVVVTNELINRLREDDVY